MAPAHPPELQICVAQGSALSISLPPTAPSPAAPFLSVTSSQEEILDSTDIRSKLQPPHSSYAAQLRTMRAASLICGRPEAVDGTTNGLLQSLVAAPGACSQPHVGWDCLMGTVMEAVVGLAQLLETCSRPFRHRSKTSIVYPMNWIIPELKKIFAITATVRQAIEGGFGGAGCGEDYLERRLEHMARHDMVNLQSGERSLENSLEGIDRVFEAAREHDQVVVLLVEYRGLSG